MNLQLEENEPWAALSHGGALKSAECQAAIAPYAALEGMPTTENNHGEKVNRSSSKTSERTVRVGAAHTESTRWEVGKLEKLLGVEQQPSCWRKAQIRKIGRGMGIDSFSVNSSRGHVVEMSRM
ncbi:hypothetical protein EYF80_007643 [Liparis tanakae]|uniref:Uncharacterized protein n=1 Tax=Liparis tanakae TaxID=230148 RepID=A0A4Z2IW80_9TELE|nr:hypothetical protein EYF80_007643 [Liparis tanakae]